MRLENFDIANPITATVAENEFITPKGVEEEVRQLVLQFDRDNFSFEVGQSIGVLVPAPHDFGNKHHFRLYSIAGMRDMGAGTVGLEIAVRRCSYIDEFSGERYKGVASNYLCDARVGDQITITGPYGQAFEIPEDRTANILMIGMGTGIAPFRAFVKRLYKQQGGWQGKVRLFYGAKSGLELVYLNDVKNDFANYYDQETFRAFQAVSSKPHLDDTVPLDRTLEENRAEVWEMILQPNTYVYVAGLEKVQDMLDTAFSKMAGSEEKWQRRKAELAAGKRWTELTY